MNIKQIKVNGLFDQFDYDIKLNKEDVTIITGPNGFGKTMILNIIYCLFSKKMYFFQKLVYKKIEVLFDDSYKISIEKIPDTSKKQPLEELNNSVSRKSKVSFVFSKNNNKIDSFLYDYSKQEQDILKQIERNIPLQRISDDQWLDMRNENIVYFDELVQEFSNVLPDNMVKELNNNYFRDIEVNNFMKAFNVHLIKEQRLLRQSYNNTRHFINKSETFLTNTIQEYAKDLSYLIKKTVDESFQITRSLDSTFPKRLLEEKGALTQIEFEERFNKLKLKQERLKKFGLSTSEQEVPAYDNQNAKVLLVYLKDSEEKTGVFDKLIDRMELFTDILNNRRFTFKTIRINREKGFVFLTLKGKNLNLTDLSSGEQHEVVLLYELIFKAKQNTLVLIDEPEISLHISWQTEFLEDLLQIIKLQNIQIIIATHSPQIINDNWHLTVDLAKQVNL